VILALYSPTVLLLVRQVAIDMQKAAIDTCAKLQHWPSACRAWLLLPP
jgi:hypothetical protein